ncbi:high-affinity methionine permease [Podospora conica]|nr:high-affinity methionine permease [Schizothecium conicum]
MAPRPEISDEQRQRYLQRGGVTVTAPTKQDRLGRFTVVCLVLNRTIGSGIHITPASVLLGTGTVGGSLLLWAFGGLIATCGLLVWLELGLSLPLFPVNIDGEEELRPVPRSGGEKNYLEFIYRRTPKNNLEASKPRYLVRCIYGIAFVALGNLSGNALAFGAFIMKASGSENSAEDDKGPIIAIAIAAITASVLVHLLSRRGGIIINNCFAVLKVAILLAIIILGFIRARAAKVGTESPKATDNFKLENSFKDPVDDVPSIANSLLFVLYTYSGWEQPFHVLAEVRTPRRIFPKYTLIAMAMTTVLYLLVNVAYFCAIRVPGDLGEIEVQRNMGLVFFGIVFDNDAAKRAMAAVIAISIFGNILVMAFTASRVKQEIAKEGILPFSLLFATSHTTPLGRWQNRNKPVVEGEYLDQTPTAALCLHWFTSVLLVAFTAKLTPTAAYSALISLYSFSLVLLVGFFTAAGLIYLHLRPSLNWRPSFKPPGGWACAAIYCAASLFGLIACFPKPRVPLTTEITWYIIPTIALSSPLWGVLWYLGLRAYMRFKGETLVVKRDPKIDREEGSDELRWITEIITHEWHDDATGSLDIPDTSRSPSLQDAFGSARA